MRSDYCVYAHCRKTDNKVFYIGKGSVKRANAKSFSGRNEFWIRTVKKYDFYSVILYRDLTEKAAFKIECDLILEIGKENLCNITDGGEGTSGRICSEETKAYMSAIFKGIKPSRKTIDAAIKKNSRKIGTVCGLRFDSITKAAEYCRSLGFHKAGKESIHSCVCGNSDKAYGFQFRYIGDNGDLILDNGFRPKDIGLKVTNGLDFFNSISDAAEWVMSNNISKSKSKTCIASNICQCCKKTRQAHTAYGFEWSYAQ